MQGASEDSWQFWGTYAERIIGSHVRLIAKPNSESQLADAIFKSHIGEIRGIAGESYFNTFYDVSKSGKLSPLVRAATTSLKHVRRSHGRARNAPQNALCWVTWFGSWALDVVGAFGPSKQIPPSSMW